MFAGQTDRQTDRQTESAYRYLHLFEVIEKGTNAVYSQHLANEESLEEDYRAMSDLTRMVLASFDYNKIRAKRANNFKQMHELLGKYNELILDDQTETPMVYPFLCKKDGLRQHLIGNRVYVPQWWKHVTDSPISNDWERHVSTYLLPIPIDQRYDTVDISDIAKIVKEGL